MLTDIGETDRIGIEHVVTVSSHNVQCTSIGGVSMYEHRPRTRIRPS